MNILAIETSSRVGSIAILRDGQLIAEESNEPVRGHGRYLLREVAKVLDAASLLVVRKIENVYTNHKEEPRIPVVISQCGEY